MNDLIFWGLPATLFLGILAQWLSWKLHLPSILLLLLFGILAGPVAGVLHPDRVFGDLLFPFVSLSVSLILFEGGLTLRFSEFRAVGAVVRRLIGIGLLLTWGFSAAAAHFLLDLSVQLSLLLGAILVVTGPTVILPMLRTIRPSPTVNSILKWEGILNDPIGAVLAVLVFEVILAAGITEATGVALTGLAATLFGGGGIGLLGALIMVVLLRARQIPDFLQNPITLAMVVAVATFSNSLQAESGLFAVTVMGIALANQRQVEVHHIIEFKENLRVLLLSVLFILLAARLEIADLTSLGWPSVLFLAVLLLVVRPAVVALSTIRSGLSWRERLFLAWMAPRGIVAAAVISLFALELSHNGYAEAERLIPLGFLVIVGTIAVYGLSARPLANLLGISDPNPQGMLIIGANPLARQLGRVLQEAGLRVLLVDNNRNLVARARGDGLETHHGSILSEHILDDLDLTGIGRLLAMTSNPEVNALASLYFSDVFGADETYQLAVAEGEENAQESIANRLQGHVLFGQPHTYSVLVDRIRHGGAIRLGEPHTEGEASRGGAPNDLLLGVLRVTGMVEMATATGSPIPREGDRSVVLSGAPPLNTAAELSELEADD